MIYYTGKQALNSMMRYHYQIFEDGGYLFRYTNNGLEINGGKNDKLGLGWGDCNYSVNKILSMQFIRIPSLCYDRLERTYNLSDLLFNKSLIYFSSGYFLKLKEDKLYLVNQFPKDEKPFDLQLNYLADKVFHLAHYFN